MREKVTSARMEEFMKALGSGVAEALVRLRPVATRGSMRFSKNRRQAASDQSGVEPPHSKRLTRSR
jgi:hypothetical protein